MAGKLSAPAQARLAGVSALAERVQHLHMLVETYATARTDPEQRLPPVARAFGQLKVRFTGAGMDGMANVCAGMETAARRGMSNVARVRILREGVASLRSQLELEQRYIVSADQDRQRKADEKASSG